MAKASSWDDIGKKSGGESAWDEIGKKPEPRPKRVVASSWDDIGAEKPQRKTGLALLKPPPGMGYTPAEGRKVVEREQAAYKERGKTKAPRSTPASKVPLADIKGYGEEREAAAAARAAMPRQSAVDISSPASRAKKNPEITKGGAGRQLMAGVASATEAVNAMSGGAINRISAPLNPLRDLANRVGDEVSKAAAKRGRVENVSDAEMGQALLRAVKNWQPWESFKQGVMNGKVTDLQFFQKLAQGDPAFRNRMEKVGGPQVVDFFASFPIDAITGRGQAAVVGKVLEKAAPLAALAEKKIPAVGRFMEDRRAYETARDAMNRGAARFDQYLRAGEDIAEDARRTSQKYLKLTRGKIREKDRLTGQTKNVFDELVADWIDAGNPGSKYEDVHTSVAIPGQVGRYDKRARELQEVQKRAEQYGIDFEDVERIGGRWSGALNELGQHLVDYRLLDPQAYERLKGQYLPRLYLLTKGDPADVRAYLKFLQQHDLIGADALRAATERLGKRGAKIPFQSRGPRQFRQQREIESFLERSDPSKARALIPEATPAALHGIRSQSRAAGEAAGHAEIAANPMLAVKVTPRKLNTAVDQELAGTTALAKQGKQGALAGEVPGEVRSSVTIRNEPPEGWVRWEGTGPLKGHYIHPGVDRLLRLQNDQGAIYNLIKEVKGPEAAQRWRELNSFVKRVWVSSPKTAVNNISGNVALGHSAAAVEGIDQPLPVWLAGYAKAVKEIRDLKRGGQISPYLQEALLDTSILRESALEAPAAATRVGSGFGVETAGEKLRQAPSEAFRWYGQTLYGDPEKAGRYHLYKVLRENGKSVREAEKIVNDAMITYSNVSPWVKELERNAIIGLPFITFPLKATSRVIGVGLKRPDEFNTMVGARFQQFLDSLADEERRKRGLPVEAKRKRAAGQVGPFEFAVPPMTLFGKEYGAGENQLYARAAPFAPFAGVIGSNRGGPLAENIGERLKGLNPLGNLISSVWFNQNSFTGQPIVKPGSIPGTKGNAADVLRSGEAAWKFGSQVLRSIFPQAADFERLLRAGTGTPEYESLSAPTPHFRGAMLRALTGINIQEGFGTNPLERAAMVEQKLRNANPTAAKQFAFDYMGELFRKRGLDANWTPNPRLQQIADSYKPEALYEASKNASDRLMFEVAKPGADDEKRRKVREYMDWIFALSVAQERAIRGQAQFLSPEQVAPFAGALGAGP